MHAAHEPVEFKNGPSVMDPAFGKNFSFQNDLGVGDAGNRHGLTVREAKRLITQTAGKGELVDAKICFKSGRDQFVRMRADGNRNRQWLLFRERALGELAHVVRRHDVDAGDISFFKHQAIDASVDAELRIFGDDDAAGDHRSAIHNREYRHGQIEEINFFAGDNDFFHRRVGDPLGLIGLSIALPSLSAMFSYSTPMPSAMRLRDCNSPETNGME